jgi:ERCC4-type nuclease
MGSILAIQNADIEILSKVAGKAKAELIKKHFESLNNHKA